MCYIPHITIHAPEDMEIVGMGVGGVDKNLHGGNGIVLLAQQAAVMVAATGIVVWIETLPLG